MQTDLPLQTANSRRQNNPITESHAFVETTYWYLAEVVCPDGLYRIRILYIYDEWLGMLGTMGSHTPEQILSPRLD